ncbi:MAG: TIGR02281 family clan AA aspartic protease [Caulobacterales bacterium]
MTGQGGPWGGGPWDAPPSPPPARKPIPIGLFIWLALIFGAALIFWGLTQVFPSQFETVDWPYALQALGLLALISSGLVAARRIRWGRTVRYMAMWAGVGAALVVGFTFRGDLVAAALRVRAELIPAYAVTTSAHSMVITQSADGNFYVMGAANGAPVRFLVDTGSSEIVLSPADAQRIGIDVGSLKFSKPAETANGVGYGASATLGRLEVGQVRLSDVPVSVNQAPMSASLLGMTFFKRMDSFEIRGDRLFLHWRG